MCQPDLRGYRRSAPQPDFERSLRGMKKKAHGPNRKRMDRTARLQSARSTQWVQKYTGKNIVRGYCNWYGVDALSAAIELKQLGVSISAELEEKLRQAAARRPTGPKQGEVSHSPDSDDTFAFIAGYTPAGFPYGVTWEEMGETPPWVQEEESESARRD